MKKEIVVVLAIFLASFMSVLPFIQPAKAQAETATVFIDCPDTINIGTFQVKVNISDVTGLYGWEFKLYFDNSLLRYVDYDLTGCFLEEVGSTFQVDKCNNDYNETHGVVWLADTLMGPGLSANGSGTLVIITFEALDVGTVELVFEDQLPEMEGKNVKLGDASANKIPNIAIDKTINVVPEFVPSILLILFLTTSIVAIYFTKKRKFLK